MAAGDSPEKGNPTISAATVYNHGSGMINRFVLGVCCSLSEIKKEPSEGGRLFTVQAQRACGLLSHVLDVRIGSETGVVGQVPAGMIGVVIDDNVIRIP